MTTSVEEARAALRARLGERFQAKRHGLSRKQMSVGAAAAAAAGPDHAEKVRSTLHKLGATDMSGGDVVFFTKGGEQVMHFARPKVSIAPNANTAFVSGAFTARPEEEFNTDKQLMELIQKFSALKQPPPPAVDEVPELVPDDFEAAATALD